MQLKAAVAIWIVFTGDASARSAGAEGRTRVVVCMQRFADSVLAISQAQAITSSMFERIDVALVWREWNHCPVEEQPIMVSLSTETPETLFPKALAYSQPFEGVHIRVFYDRLRRMEQLCPMPVLLAHVLAHEIGHILQGTDQHSASGVMKSRWDGGDYARMARQPLPFSDLDTQLIHRGLKSWADRLRGSAGPVP